MTCADVQVFLLDVLCIVAIATWGPQLFYSYGHLRSEGERWVFARPSLDIINLKEVVSDTWSLFAWALFNVAPKKKKIMSSTLKRPVSATTFSERHNLFKLIMSRVVRWNGFFFGWIFFWSGSVIWKFIENHCWSFCKLEIHWIYFWSGSVFWNSFKTIFQVALYFRNSLKTIFEVVL